MTGKNFKYDRAACIVAESDVFGIEEVAKRWGVSDRTIWRYKAKCVEDELLAELVTRKKAKLSDSWTENASRALNTALNELNKKIPLMKTEEDAKIIYSIVGAIKVVGELKITADTLSADESSYYLEGQPPSAATR